MITIPTFFVLGAGASWPYGYPLGSELKRTICDQLLNDQSGLCRVLHSLDFGRSDIVQFRKSLFYSGKISVDAFLEHREEFIEIGKSAIACSLMLHEHEEKMFITGDWYEYFYNMLNVSSLEEFDQNEASIITFNYDRSLEQYLFTALKNTFGESDRACASKLNNISIVHVYGQLAPLPWQDVTRRDTETFPWQDNSRRYNPDIDSVESLEKAASGIRIIHENKDLANDPEFNKAHSLICKATNVCFLGTGYNETNVRRLNISCGSKPKHYYGTAYGLKNAERSKIVDQFGRNNADIFFTKEDVDTLGFLREMPVLI